MKKKAESNAVAARPPVELKEYMHLVREGDMPGLEALVSSISSAKFFSFDTETDGRHFMLAALDGIGFYVPEQNAGFYVNVYKTSSVWYGLVIAALKPVFENDKVGKMGHNIMYDMHVMKNAGVDVNGPILDTMIAAYIVNPDDRPLKLKSLVPRHLGIEMQHYDDIDREDLLAMAHYCMEDARCTYLLYVNRKEKLVSGGMWELFINVEMPFLRVLFDMERVGIRVDRDRLEGLRLRFNTEAEQAKNEFCRIMFGVPSDKVLIRVTRKVKGQKVREDVPFNIDSSDHLGELLYNIKGYPAEMMTKGSKTSPPKPSTAKLALVRMAEKGHPGLDLLMKYRGLQKLLTSFVNPILDEHMINGRVHSSYLQFGTRTGRLSSASPNFQNIPVRTEEGKELRRCFIADKGCVLIDADLSQIELRVMAHFSNDVNLVKAYKENLDLHDLTGQLVLGLPPGETKKKEKKPVRTLCKGLNFGLQYGAGPRKFAIVANMELPEGAKITEADAKKYIDTYFKKYYGMRAFQVAYPKEVKAKGYATTILGRRRYLPDIRLPRTSNDPVYRKLLWKKISKAEREALSTLIQGTAADVLKLAMIRARAEGIVLLGQIHDQLLATCKAPNAVREVAMLKDCMENCGLKFRVPIVADIQVVERWEGPIIEGNEREDEHPLGIDAEDPEIAEEEN